MLAVLVLRVAVMVSDPSGRGDSLADAVVQRLRADGWDAVAVAPPRGRIDSPAQQDALAKRVGADRVLALEVHARRQRLSRGGEVRGSYPPSVRVWRFEVETMSQAMPLEGDAGPTLPSATIQAPRLIEEEVRAQTRLLWRRVGQPRFEIDRQVGTGALTGWREDTAAIESQQAIGHEAQLWRRLFAEVASEAAETIEMQ